VCVRACVCVRVCVPVCVRIILGATAPGMLFVCLYDTMPEACVSSRSYVRCCDADREGLPTIPIFQFIIHILYIHTHHLTLHARRIIHMYTCIIYYRYILYYIFIIFIKVNLDVIYIVFLIYIYLYTVYILSNSHSRHDSSIMMKTLRL